MDGQIESVSDVVFCLVPGLSRREPGSSEADLFCRESWTHCACQLARQRNLGRHGPGLAYESRAAAKRSEQGLTR